MDNYQKLITFFGIISIIGFVISLVFIIGITGGVIGATRANVYGLIFIIVPLLIWSILSILRIKRKEKEVNISKIIEEAQREA